MNIIEFLKAAPMQFYWAMIGNVVLAIGLYVSPMDDNEMWFIFAGIWMLLIAIFVGQDMTSGKIDKLRFETLKLEFMVVQLLNKRNTYLLHKILTLLETEAEELPEETPKEQL